MRLAASNELSEYANLGKLIGWFIIMRWVACGGVFAAILTVSVRFRYDLPFGMLHLLNGLLFLINLLFTLYFVMMRKQELSRREGIVFLNIQISCDFLVLYSLIYFTGFLENPFSFYFIFHIMLTAYIFSHGIVYFYTGALVALFVATAWAELGGVIPHFPLNSDQGLSIYNDLVVSRVIGLCSTLIITAYLISSIKSRIEERGRRVEVELDRYKSLDKVKSNFMLQVTHELRGPVAAVNGYHEMILRGITGATTQKTQDAIRKADRRTDNLLTIIDEMIDYAYMTSDAEMRYKPSELKLKETIEASIETIAVQAEEKNIRFKIQCSQDLRLWANRDLVNIILNNLLTNAVRYSDVEDTVRINAQVNEGQIHLSVADEGMGIAPEELNHIFEEFFRSRKAREKDRDGTGLGLPIVERAVEALKGKISVYSELGQETVFNIHLPVNRPEDSK